jgi:4-cresol dehydrogenase (hydroxylating)
MTGNHATEVLRIITPIYERSSFEVLATMTSINPRSLCCTLGIAYDRDDQEQGQRALACREELLEALKRGGYVPYRYGLQVPETLRDESDSFWELTAQLKHTLDPKGILSPGRL